MSGNANLSVCGVVAGLTVIVMLAYTMRLVRGRSAAVEDDMRQTYTVKHIRKGLTLLSLIGRGFVGGALIVWLWEGNHENA